MIVESPSLVRYNNMREMHFSRNPQIIEFLHMYEYVKEFGEGADRMLSIPGDFRTAGIRSFGTGVHLNRNIQNALGHVCQP